MCSRLKRWPHQPPEHAESSRGSSFRSTGAPLPQRIAVAQGDAVGRPCRLGLEVTVDQTIRVSGRVVELARGTITL